MNIKDLIFIVLLVVIILITVLNRFSPVSPKLDDSKIDSLLSLNNSIDKNISLLKKDIDSLERNIKTTKDSVIIIREYYEKKNKSIDTASVGTLYRLWSEHTK